MTFVSESQRGVDAARASRSRLGLGLEAPISDVLLLIEDLAHVPVTVLDLPAGLAGLQGRRHERTFIFINGTESSVRQRFTLAHEFGHVELGHAGSIDYIASHGSGPKRPPAEVQADGFAAEFLAPLAGVRRWLEAVGEPPDDLDTVVRLADHFHVSAEVALYRLQAARHLTKGKVGPLKESIEAGEHTSLCRRLGLGDFEDALSRAAVRLPRLPRETMSQAAAAYERGLLGIPQIAELLSIEPAMIEAEFGRRGVSAGHHEPDY